MILNKKGIFSPIDIIAGVLLILAGIVTIFGSVNLGSLIAIIGLLIELVKIIFEKGI